jgi:hypothetical protein
LSVATAERINMATKTIRQFVLIPIIREKSHHITVEARLAREPEARSSIPTLYRSTSSSCHRLRTKPEGPARRRCG